MTIGREMNQILMRILKNYPKRYILEEKYPCITIIVATMVTTMVTMMNLGYHRSNLG